VIAEPRRLNSVATIPPCILQLSWLRLWLRKGKQNREKTDLEPNGSSPKRPNRVGIPNPPDSKRTVYICRDACGTAYARLGSDRTSEGIVKVNRRTLGDATDPVTRLAA